ncbi:mitogen-activated protein kinase kinase kinase 7-like [Leptopilina heterotoma]|uniref:mitogen-activated protein kinase kinase kinase 7-like n=1 Tax=Leptopilina heterotoma TaxID=63436 RepID=UPI001CA7CD36|nr:mitogen-activated protein kinase kinase kinase 7-like [Leptopilina heterotoma]
MASKEGTGHQQQFVEEIDFKEIERQEIVGKGSFGVVWKGKWRGQYVAVKLINSEGEKKAFSIEVRQLSRVAHPNIVKLYGACTKNPVCLVMEYAEGGSLYNVLHCDPQPHYTVGHAMSWALQCARGVAYLHNMKPKPLIHRDLKPPNLLLIMGGQTLKICDFGTACDLKSYMTNNKGSAAWMAPEVFEGSRYTEKCDVFSWGIILWEVLSRRKPFDDIGGSAYRIMWAVHIGQRPALLESCPKPIERLMTRCWSKVPDERPSMVEVVRIMTALSEMFSGELGPVEYSLSSEADMDDEDDEETRSDTLDTLDMPSTLNSLINGSMENGLDRTPMPTEVNDEMNGNSIQKLDLNEAPVQIQSKLEFTNDDSWKNVIPINAESHVSTSSNLSFNQRPNIAPLKVECDPNAWELGNSFDSSWEIRNMAGLDKMAPKSKKNLQGSSTMNEDLDNVYRLLDNEQRPRTPDHTCPQSREIFEEHKQLAQEYLKVQTEIALLSQQKNALLKNLSIEDRKQKEELLGLEKEKESLRKLYQTFKHQLEMKKNQSSGIQNQRPPAIPSIGPAVSGEDGWIVVSRQDPSRMS